MVVERGQGRSLIGSRLLALVSALFWALPFFGVIDLAVPIDETPGFYLSYLLETGWGVLYTFLVAAAFVLLAVRPGAAMPAVQVGVAAACLAVTAIAAGSWVQLLPAVVLAVDGAAVVALVPARLRTARRPGPPDVWVGVVAAGAVPPALVFALDMVRGFREGRPPLDDDTWGIDHWPTQAAMALAVAASAIAVSLAVRARWPGALGSGVCVAVAAAWFGYWSVAYPAHAGSAGDTWGRIVVAWAAVFLGVVCWRVAAMSRARTPDPTRPTSGSDRG